MSASVVQFDSVTKRYRTGVFAGSAVQALRGVSFEIPAGSVFGVLGPNRAGKSTLLKILLSICRPTGGTVRRFEQPAANLATLGRVGFMHENQAFPRYLTAPALLNYYGALAGVSPLACKARGGELLKRVKLDDRIAEPIANFSKGMIQRLALAQALLNQPDLLVLDEPTEGLDQLARRTIYDVVAEQKSAGKTTLLVSHIVEDVDRLCDRAVVIVEGKVAFSGDLQSLKRTPDGGSRSLGEALTKYYETGVA